MLRSNMPCVMRRLAPALAAALLLLALAARPARAQEPSVQRLSCGGYDVVPSGFGSAGRPSRLSIQKGGRLLESITDWTITSTECADITAGQARDLVVRTFSGGAHCCETLRVYALAEKPRLLLLYEANNAMGVEVRDIMGDGRRELILGDDSFAYFDDLSYTESPRSLPLIACFVDGRFDDCTRQFPEWLRSRRDDDLARLTPPEGDTGLKEAEGRALRVLALSALLGEEEQGLTTIRAAVSDERVMAWLSKALPHVRDWLAARGKKLKDKK
jgi:hypothetical protein